MSEESTDKKPNHAKVMYSDFADSTSAHGISHINKAGSKKRKIFWFIVTLILVIFWIVHCEDTISQYLKFEVNVQVDVKVGRQLPFPTVTVCNQNPYKGYESIQFIGAMYQSALIAVARNEAVGDLAPTWIIPWVEFLMAENTVNTTGYDNSGKAREQILQLLSELLDFYGEQYGYKFKDMTTNPDDFVLGCMYEQDDCSKRGDVTRTTVFNWLHGHCVMYTVHHNSTRTGPRFGLELTLNINQEQYMDLTTKAGALVLVHPQHQMPFPDDDGISIPPGQAALVGVKVRKVERLGGKYSNCIHDGNLPKNIPNYFKQQYKWTGYSLKTCQKSCIQKSLREVCNCFDVRFPPYDELRTYNACLTEYYSTYDFSQGWPNTFGCRDEVMNNFTAHELGCDEECFVPCEEIVYAPSVSYAAWPSDAALNTTLNVLKGISKSADKVIDSGPEAFRKNILQVNVYFEDLNYEFISEGPAVELAQMLSDLAGNTGIYIGASLFTFIEFGEFFVHLFTWTYKNRRSKEPADNNTRNQERQGPDDNSVNNAENGNKETVA